MDYIKLLSERYLLNETWSHHGVTILKGEELYLQLIEPHHGTGFLHCMRADFPETFDRWSAAPFEEEFLNDGGFIQVVESLDSFLNNKITYMNENKRCILE